MPARKSPLRYANEAVGAFVLLSVIVFIAAVLQSGRLHNWFNPGLKLKVILPEAGSFGLSGGADVKILGTEAGKVSRIVVDPNYQIHAIVDLKRNMKAFVRRDSKAIIRKEFGVAGAAYLEITRGTGEPLDWEYAVIKAVVERAPTESIGELLSELRTKVMPILDTAQSFLVNLNAISAKMARGEGSLGRLLVDDRLAGEVEALLTQIRTDTRQLGPILQTLQSAADNISVLTSRVAAQSRDLPQMSQDVGRVLSSLQSVMQDLNRTTTQLPKLAEQLRGATGDVPLLLSQTQQTLYELERLILQLRSSWLLGGGGQKQPPEGRISTLEVVP